MRNIKASLADVIALPFAPVAAAVSLAVARSYGRMKWTQRVFDRFGTFPIRHHYYSPLVYESDLREPLDRERHVEGLDLNEKGQLALLGELRYGKELLAIPRRGSGTDPAFQYDNRQFGVGDAEMYYSVIRRFRPRRILEIGCGQSTLMAQLAVAANRREAGDYACEHICVEPFENDWLERIGVKLHRAKIECVDPAFVDELEAGDILFIDSSHQIRPQGDVLHEYLRLVGRVRPGVLIHAHDIFTPRDYPRSWVLNQRRLWNEQYLLEAFLCFNRSYEVIAAVNWLWHAHRAEMSRACPVLAADPGAEPASFWFRRCA
jgi:hypothetical protein